MRLFAGTPFDRPTKCDRCGALETECDCPPVRPAALAAGSQTAVLRVEKRKRGKIVTVIAGLTAAQPDLADLLSQLKTVCGAGGTLKEGVLEVQGDHLDRLRETLGRLGYKVRG